MSKPKTAVTPDSSLPAFVPAATPEFAADEFAANYSAPDHADDGNLTDPVLDPLLDPLVDPLDLFAPLHFFEAEADAAGERLDKWLARQLPMHSRNRLQDWIESGAVRVNDAPARLRQKVLEGDVIAVMPIAALEDSSFAPEAMDLAIVYEDEDLMVIDKPAGLVVHPAAGNWSGTLLNGVLHHHPGAALLARAGIVHRLDKDTSGLMVVAKTDVAQTDLVRQLQARTVRREYLALVQGAPRASGTVNVAIGRHPRERTRMAAFKIESAATKPAVTHFEVLQQRDNHALVRCRLETGRTHQIRVHMQFIGHSLVGDVVYGGRPVDGFTRQALHAWRLGLIHPRDGSERAWSAAPPADFQALLAHLGFDPVEMPE